MTASCLMYFSIGNVKHYGACTPLLTLPGEGTTIEPSHTIMTKSIKRPGIYQRSLPQLYVCMSLRDPLVTVLMGGSRTAFASAIAVASGPFHLVLSGLPTSLWYSGMIGHFNILATHQRLRIAIVRILCAANQIGGIMKCYCFGRAS